MFRCNWKELGLIRFLTNLLKPKSARKGISNSESPWQGDLAHLASRYGDDGLLTTYKTNLGEEAAQQLHDLCNEVKDDESDTVVVRVDRLRQPSTTSVDLKAWWGQSVATWDPIDGKNVDSIDQQRRPRKAKWFDQH